MPKISNNRISIYKDSITIHYEVVVMYNQSNLFYAVIPDQFNAAVKHLSSDELKTFFISTERTSAKRSFTNDDELRYIICSKSEGDCIEKWKTAIRHLLDRQIEKRNVIVIHFVPNDTTSYGNLTYNKEHPQIGMKFGIAYGIETKSGDVKNYKKAIKYSGHDGEEVTRYQDMTLWRGGCTIIDDTEENRIFLTNLYNALQNLHDKLKEFTASSESILQLINSGTRLIGN